MFAMPVCHGNACLQCLFAMVMHNYGDACLQYLFACLHW
ncbi:hypothetical protein SPBRAN_831 [uncultured Candidatus Thioglobus sp.]|nr:hypothetical protein SPBRAN_831 [uncultured Candidatus Thioglobus sp.]